MCVCVCVSLGGGGVSRNLLSEFPLWAGIQSQAGNHVWCSAWAVCISLQLFLCMYIMPLGMFVCQVPCAGEHVSVGHIWVFPRGSQEAPGYSHHSPQGLYTLGLRFLLYLVDVLVLVFASHICCCCLVCVFPLHPHPSQPPVLLLLGFLVLIIYCASVALMSFSCSIVFACLLVLPWYDTFFFLFFFFF